MHGNLKSIDRKQFHDIHHHLLLIVFREKHIDEVLIIEHFITPTIIRTWVINLHLNQLNILFDHLLKHHSVLDVTVVSPENIFEYLKRFTQLISGQELDFISPIPPVQTKLEL